MSKPTEDECWKRFWKIMGPAIADAVYEGRVTQDDYDASTSSSDAGKNVSSSH